MADGPTSNPAYDPAPSTDEYVFKDAEAASERARLQQQEAVWDPISVPRLEISGVSEGWQCLDVGAGAGSITRWLARRVGPSGKVVAADIDPRFLDDVPRNVEVRKCDIRSVDLEDSVYDLVYARLLLENLSDPLGALKRMTNAVRPGGLVMAESHDFGLMQFHGGPDSETLNRTLPRLLELLVENNVHLLLGRSLPGLFLSAGLEVLDADFITKFVRHGDPHYEYLSFSFTAAVSFAVQAGLLTPNETELWKDFFEDPNTAMTTNTIVSVLGQRPRPL